MKLSEMVRLAKTSTSEEMDAFTDDEEDFDLACALTGFAYPLDADFMAGFVAGILAERKSTNSD